MSEDRVLAGRVNARLGQRYRLQVVGGAPEPLYRPARAGTPARIHYSADHVRSLLHELAHWCLAGAERRRLEDYGYWYEPPPRRGTAQRRFFRAERDVQALEQVFSEACGVAFEVSVDDLGDRDGDVAAFARAVALQAAVLRAALAEPADPGAARRPPVPGAHGRTRAVLSALQ